MPMSSVAETYRNASEDELIALCADTGSLTDEARELLRVELSRRGLTDEQVAAQIETLKREQAEQKQVQAEAKRKRPVRWLLIFAQIGIVLAAAALTVLIPDLLRLNAAQSGSVGQLAAYGTVLTMGTSLAMFRGKLRATLITCLVVDGAVLVIALIASR